MNDSHRSRRTLLIGLPLLFASLALPSAGFAQATRTWVSGVGDDVNPCSRTAPCKTFAGAISKTASGGEINALDPGGYGGVTITKPITIDGGHNHASVLVSGTNGIVINATTPGMRVTLRNLSVTGVSNAGLAGVRIIGQRSNVRIEKSSIFGFSTAGVDVAPSSGTPSKVQIRRTSIHGNYGPATNAAGLLVRPTGGVHARVNVSDSSIDDNANGVVAESSEGLVTVTLRSTSVDDNGADEGAGVGIRAQGSNATVRFGGGSVVGNLIGLEATGGAGVQSFGNNVIFGNDAGNTPSAGVPLS